MRNSPDIDRRKWLTRGFLGFILAAGGSILLDVWRAAGRFSSARWTEVTLAGALKNPGRYPFARQKVVLLRETERLAALSLECTHLGCLLNPTDQGFYCPCHGSVFGPDGTVYSGPAKVNLPWYPVRLDGGRVWIRTGEKQRDPEWVTI